MSWVLAHLLCLSVNPVLYPGLDVPMGSIVVLL